MKTTTMPSLTDPEPVPPPSEASVALIVGGRFGGLSGFSVMRSAELFGCPGFEDRSFPIKDFPQVGVYLATSTFYSNGGIEPKAVVCGGFQCSRPVFPGAGPTCGVMIFCKHLVGF